MSSRILNANHQFRWLCCGWNKNDKNNHNPFHHETTGQLINNLHFWIPQIISVKINKTAWHGA